jgi:hypothetical protein
MVDRQCPTLGPLGVQGGTKQLRRDSFAARRGHKQVAAGAPTDRHAAESTSPASLDTALSVLVSEEDMSSYAALLLLGLALAR